MSLKITIGSLIALIAIAAAFSMLQSSDKKSVKTNQGQSALSKQNSIANQLGLQEESQATDGCFSNPNPIFTADISELATMPEIIPPGNIDINFGRPGEMIIKSHAWLKAQGEVPVYAPIDALLYTGAFYFDESIPQYGFFMEVSCEIFIFYDHIISPSKKLKDAFPYPPLQYEDFGPVAEPVLFKAGELIGHTTGTTRPNLWDFGVFDRSNINENVKEQTGVRIYGRDKIGVCPFDLYPPAKRAEYYARFVSSKGEPIPTQYCFSS